MNRQVQRGEAASWFLITIICLGFFGVLGFYAIGPVLWYKAGLVHSLFYLVFAILALALAAYGVLRTITITTSEVKK